MSKIALAEAVRLADGQAALAARLRAAIPGSKVSQAHVWKWLNAEHDLTPPADYVIPIARITEWKITPHMLRDDLYPHPDDGLPVDIRGSLQDSDRDRPTADARVSTDAGKPIPDPTAGGDDPTGREAA